MRALAAVRHADAPRVDDLAPVGQPGERHVGVPADHRHHVVGEFGEDLGPPLKPGVNDDHLLVVPRRGVAEDDRAETVHLERDRVGQAGQPVDVVGGQLPRGPRRNGVADVVDHAAGQVHEFPVRVAAHPGDPVAEAEQPVERLRRLGSGGDVAGEDDEFGVADVRFGQHRVERREDGVDVGQDGDGRDHHDLRP